MSTFTYGQSNLTITVPIGRYTAKFVGTEDREGMDMSKFPPRAGKPQQTGIKPRMAWVWEIVGGEHAGTTVAQETGTVAVARSGCSRVLSGLYGGQIAIGQKVDPKEKIGKMYSIDVGVNPDSEKGALYISAIMPLDGSPAPAAGAPPNRPAAPRPPAGPPRPAGPPKPPPPAAPVEEMFWCLDAQGEPLGAAVGRAEMQAHIMNSKIDPSQYQVCKVGEDAWRAASTFGFLDKMPF
jgi:hypothetical protein